MQLRPLIPGLILAGALASACLLLFGAFLLTASRGSGVVFWLSEIILLVVIWRIILSRFTPRDAGTTIDAGGTNTLGLATATSAAAFFALWVFAVAFSGGRVGLIVILAYVMASGVLLFLLSIRNRLTSVNYEIRMPLIAAGAVVMIAVGLIYLGGGPV